MIWWILLGIVVLFFGIPLVCMFFPPELYTWYVVWRWNKWHTSMKRNPDYEEIRDAEGNFVEFRKKEQHAG